MTNTKQANRDEIALDLDALSILDDGTQDTVFQCYLCGGTLRYSEVERDSSGEITSRAWDFATIEHADTCDKQGTTET